MIDQPQQSQVCHQDAPQAQFAPPLDVLHCIDHLVHPPQAQADVLAGGRQGLSSDIEGGPRSHEQADLHLAVPGDLQHVLDLVVGHQHDPAALADPMDGEPIALSFLDDRLEAARALHAGYFKAILGSVRKTLGRAPQGVAVARRGDRAFSGNRESPSWLVPFQLDGADSSSAPGEFQTSPAPAPTTGGSFERETGDPDGVSGTRKGVGSPRLLTSCVFVDNSFYSVTYSVKPGCFRQAAPPPPRRADHSREKQGTRMAYREHEKISVPLGVSLRVSWSFFVCLRG